MLAHRALTRFASDWDVNAWLGTHSVHLFGTRSFAQLLGAHARGRLLDVGAGSGELTSALAPLFDSIVCVETSAPAARRLRARFGRALALDLATAPLPEPAPFDVVALLHVLDRCDRPRTLLDRALEHLAPEGAMLLALPLPASPHVDRGGATVDQDEPFDARGPTFEEALERLVARELAPRGLRVIRWTRAKYLSRGDASTPLIELDDAVLVCARAARDQ